MLDIPGYKGKPTAHRDRSDPEIVLTDFPIATRLLELRAHPSIDFCHRRGIGDRHPDLEKTPDLIGIMPRPYRPSTTHGIPMLLPLLRAAYPAAHDCRLQRPMRNLVSAISPTDPPSP